MATWYRGESTTAAPAKAGGFLHDFGDGMYFTNDLGVAQTYARKRVQESGGGQQVYRIELESARLGRVLDLNGPQWGKQWKEFSAPIEGHMRASNENYGRSFQNFLKLHKININEFNAVVGPEYVNGGVQICILHKNGQPSPQARAARAMMQPLSGKLPAAAPAVRPAEMRNVRLQGWWKSRSPAGARGGVPIPYAQEFYQRQGGAVNAWAAFGMMLASTIQGLNNRAIDSQVQKELETTYKDRIERSFAGGQGVLVIINVQEPILEDVNGFRSKVLRSVVLQTGPSAEFTLARWKNGQQLLAGPDPNCRIVEQYLWLDPHS